MTAVQLSGVIGGTITDTVTLIDTIRLAGRILTVARVVIADLRECALWGLGRKHLLFQELPHPTAAHRVRGAGFPRSPDQTSGSTS